MYTFNLEHIFVDRNEQTVEIFHKYLQSPDFNEDDYVCENDLKKVISRLCGEQKLSNENMQGLIEKVSIIINKQ